jgi:voltage-gated potassium channel
MDERSERVQRRFDVPVMVAALLTIPLLVIEESNYGQPWDGIGVALNWGTWLVFLAEVVVMLAVVPNRMRWARENPIAVGVTALTPPFLSAFAPIRLLRLLRVLRLIRLAPIMRRVFSVEGLRYAAILVAVTLVTSGVAFAAVEPHRTALEGIYWALTTMTTVGYGDLSPTTTGGRVLAAVVMIVGIGFVAIVTGAVAERFLAPSLSERPWRSRRSWTPPAKRCSESFVECAPSWTGSKQRLGGPTAAQLRKPAALTGR